jgi:hypothetical protein
MILNVGFWINDSEGFRKKRNFKTKTKDETKGKL